MAWLVAETVRRSEIPENIVDYRSILGHLARSAYCNGAQLRTTSVYRPGNDDNLVYIAYAHHSVYPHKIKVGDYCCNISRHTERQCGFVAYVSRQL